MNVAHSSPILRTKLIPPTLSESYLSRKRVFDCLNAALHHPVLLITAPAGSGKTASLADFAQKNSFLTGWLSLEETDNDPVRFWQYFFAALKRILPGFQLDTPITLPEMGMGFLSRGLDALCNYLIDLPHPLILILDDFQRVHQSNILKAITYLVDHQPTNFHLIISSRTSPDLPLARWRAKGMLAEIYTKDLAFLKEEVINYSERRGNCFQNDRQIQQILEMTQGWAAGIRLMDIATQGNPDQSDAGVKGRRLAADYLTGEILEQLPHDWLVFLEQIAIFDQFTPEMAVFLTKIDDSRSLIERITRANLFLQQQGDVWQFHPFFREALLSKLTDAKRISLHKRAAAWFDSHSRPDKAIISMLAAEDWNNAVRLILQQADDQLQKGEIYTLNGWIQSIPEDKRNSYPDLLVTGGWIYYLQGKNAEAQHLVDYLEKTTTKDQIHRQDWWAGLRCQMALLQENNQQALDLAQIALAENNGSNNFIRGLLITSLATAQQALGDSEGAIVSFKEALRINRNVGSLFTSIFSLAGLGIELNEQGERLRAMELCHQELEDREDPPAATNPLYGLIYLLLARLHWEANALNEAQNALETASRQFERLGIPGFQISADVIRAQILVAREDYGEALRLVNFNRRRTRSAEFVGFHQLFDMLKASIMLKMGNLSSVENWLEEAHLPTKPQDEPAREMEFVLKASYLVEKGLLHEAEQLLDDLLIYAQNTHHIRIAISTLLIRATLEWKKGELGRCKQHLEEAVALAVPQQYFRLLLEYGTPLSGLLARMPETPAQVRLLFCSDSSQEPSELFEMLTRREIEVLRLLTENHTNTEIAETLVLSSETVKVHLKHIFQKLSVDNRRQAVRRARQLNII
jgi:LuxR family maltose regulon positive regulatory protein